MKKGTSVIKKAITIFLSLLLLVFAASAAETDTAEQDRYQCSPWAQAYVTQKVYYQGIFAENVYYYHREGNQGAKLFDKGRYTVTLDLATGAQTWTRAEL